MAIKKYVNSAWQDVDAPKRYENSAWVECESAHRYNNGAWEETWSAGIPASGIYVSGDNDPNVEGDGNYASRNLYAYIEGDYIELGGLYCASTTQWSRIIIPVYAESPPLVTIDEVWMLGNGMIGESGSKFSLILYSFKFDVATGGTLATNYYYESKQLQTYPTCNSDVIENVSWQTTVKATREENMYYIGLSLLFSESSRYSYNYIWSEIAIGIKGLKINGKKVVGSMFAS